MFLDKEYYAKVLSETVLKALRIAGKTGSINVKHVNLINAVKNIIANGCAIGLSQKEEKEVNSLFFKILNTSSLYVTDFEDLDQEISIYKNNNRTNSSLMILRKEYDNNNAPVAQNFEMISDSNFNINITATEEVKEIILESNKEVYSFSSQDLYKAIEEGGIQYTEKRILFSKISSNIALFSDDFSFYEGEEEKYPANDIFQFSLINENEKEINLEYKIVFRIPGNNILKQESLFFSKKIKLVNL